MVCVVLLYRYIHIKNNKNKSGKSRRDYNHLTLTDNPNFDEFHTKIVLFNVKNNLN